jgi:hypothetical protein
MNFRELQVVKVVRCDIFLIHVFWSVPSAEFLKVRDSLIKFFKRKKFFVIDVVDNIGSASVISIHIAWFLDEISPSSDLAAKWVRAYDSWRFREELWIKLIRIEVESFVMWPCDVSDVWSIQLFAEICRINMMEPFVSWVINVGIYKFLVLGPVDNRELSVVYDFILKHQVFEKLSFLS